MSATLFELGEHEATMPTYDLEAAADFYIPLRDKAALLGLGEFSTRLARMAEIDAQIVREATETGTAPIFLSPDAYPIEGDAPTIFHMVSTVRRLITQPSTKDLRFGPVNNVEGSEEDETVLAQIDEFERLMVHPDYKPVGYVAPDYHKVHWYMPSVINGIAIQKEEMRGNGNEGQYEKRNGEWVPMPFKARRVIGLTVYRTKTSD